MTEREILIERREGARRALRSGLAIPAAVDAAIATPTSCFLNKEDINRIVDQLYPLPPLTRRRIVVVPGGSGIGSIRYQVSPDGDRILHESTTGKWHDTGWKPESLLLLADLITHPDEEVPDDPNDPNEVSR